MKKGNKKARKNTAFDLACPICNEKMTPFGQECEDGSGWYFGYLCGCTKEKRDEYYEKTIDVKVAPFEIDIPMPRVSAPQVEA